jgi:uncharacterized protein
MGGAERKRTGFVLARSTPFSYECRACKRCCKDKIIPLNPYEVARLAEHVGLTTTAFLAQHTGVGGAALRRRDDGTCVLLGEGGCTVHPARPLACRLYPLGRHVSGTGEESFAEVEPHPQTEGVYGTDGSIGDYLHRQQVEPYLAAADRYSRVLAKMLTALATREDRREVDADATAAVGRNPTTVDDNPLDMDATVGRFCAERGRAVPPDVEAKTLLHIEALEAML